MAKKTKKITKSSEKSTKRTVRDQSQSSDKEKIIWMFDKIDTAGEFAFDLNKISSENLKEIFDKMISYSTMTWGEIKRQTHDNGKSKHHFLDLKGMSDSAKKRIEMKHLEEDTDAVFSFALTNTLRIIGIRENRYFHVVWYDENHKFYPSSKKHT